MKRNGDWRFHLLRESLRKEAPQRNQEASFFAGARCEAG